MSAKSILASGHTERSGSKEQRLADAARGLAYECVSGTAPPLIRYMFYEIQNRRVRCCVLGEVSRRARIDPRQTEAMRGLWFRGFPASALEAASLAVRANNDSPDDSRHAAVVFPLLWLADELEAASRDTSSPPKAKE